VVTPPFEVARCLDPGIHITVLLDDTSEVRAYLLPPDVGVRRPDLVQ
jgi:hypothetical protein